MSFVQACIPSLLAPLAASDTAPLTTSLAIVVPDWLALTLGGIIGVATVTVVYLRKRPPPAPPNVAPKPPKLERDTHLLDRLDTLIAELDTDLRIVWCNAAAANITGVPREQLIGQHCFAMRWKTAQPCEGCLTRQAIRTGQPRTGPFVSPDGRHWHVHVEPITDQHGHVIGAIENVRERTREETLSQARQSNEERLRMVAQAEGIAVYDYDFSTDTLDRSDVHREWFGETQPPPIAWWQARIHPQDRPKILEAFDALLACPGDHWEQQYRIRCADGNYIDVRDFALLLRDAQGRPRRLVGAVRDITADRLAERERDELIAELQQALRNVKHLRGLLPICAGCKKIRTDEGYWEAVDVYIHAHADVQFSHGLCPDCVHRLYPELEDLGDTHQPPSAPPPQVRSKSSSR